MTLPKTQRYERGFFRIALRAELAGLLREVPAPDVLARPSIFGQEAGLRDVQNERFKEILKIGWSNPIIATLVICRSPAEHVRSIDDYRAASDLQY